MAVLKDGLCMALAVAATVAGAGQVTQDLAAVRQTALSYAAAQAQAHGDGTTSVRVGRLDERLRLSPCLDGLEAFLPAGSTLTGNTTIGVRCLGPTTWSVYLSARVTAFAEVVVARRYLPRGTVLTGDTVELASKDVGTLNMGYFSAVSDLSGQVLKRALRPGVVVTPGLIAPVMAVRRGERVEIRARAGGLEVTSMGKALADGAVGDWIEVRNMSSKKVIEGRVEGPGVVQVSL
jgi:flagella basal body P-ring formation protein FlgA